MPKSFAYGNGQMLVTVDAFARIRDCYFPYVGLENHVAGKLAHKIGIHVDGRFSWFDDGSWEITSTLDDGWVGETVLKKKDFQIELVFRDTLYNEKNVFVREITIHNQTDRARKVKFFTNQQFEIYRSEKGDTAYYDPRDQVVIHYEGRRVFLIGMRYQDRSFDDYTTGIFQIEGKEGTYKDAEDGMLQKNAIEHGMVDSTIGMTIEVEANASAAFHYIMCVGHSIEEAKELYHHALKRGISRVLNSTHDFWQAWVNRNDFHFYGLSESVIDLFKKSQFYLRSHVDRHGAIIAAGDSDMLDAGRDTYAYVWPRDAVFSAIALDWMGDRHSARKFYEFAAKTIKPEGYFMHRNRADGSLGSSWHPWVVDGHTELPIQEDETALVLWALWEHYEVTKDIEFIESLYSSLILPAANFLLTYRDSYTNLPKPSYNLWEEKFGIHTFTASSVYGGLIAASKFSGILGKTRSEHNFRHAAEEVQSAILKHLYNNENGSFYKTMSVDQKGMMTLYDTTPDASSAFAVFMFGVLPPGDDRLVRAMKWTEEKLLIRTSVGGIARYENDQYFRVTNDVPGNPWIITSLWLAQYAIARATSDQGLEVAREWLNWCTRMALPTGVLPEQMHPYTKAHLSTGPLTWSHAEFIRTVYMYLEKLEVLGITKPQNIFTSMH